MKRITGALCVVALAFVGAGCGGDDEEKLSAADFKSQGNAICKKGNDELDAAASKAFQEGKEPDKETVRTFLKDEAIPNIRKQIDAIDDLAAPDELSDRVDDLVAEAKAALAKFEDAAKSDDPTTLFNSNEDPFADANKIATEVGLTACADSSDEGS